LHDDVLLFVPDMSDALKAGFRQFATASLVWTSTLRHDIGKHRRIRGREEEVEIKNETLLMSVILTTTAL